MVSTDGTVFLLDVHWYDRLGRRAGFLESIVCPIFWKERKDSILGKNTFQMTVFF